MGYTVPIINALGPYYNTRKPRLLVKKPGVHSIDSINLNDTDYLVTDYFVCAAVGRCQLIPVWRDFLQLDGGTNVAALADASGGRDELR